MLAFALLILYHVGMTYVAAWDWHVKSTHAVDGLQLPMLLLNRWRMSLLFLISGVAIGLARMEDAPGRFVQTRSLRLLLPLAFAMLTQIPLQAYCEDVSHGLVPPGLGRYLHAYLDVFHLPSTAPEGWALGLTWNHLWYLAYVWAYTVVLMALLPLRRLAWVQRAAAWLRGLRGIGLLLVPALPMVVYLWLLAPSFPATRAFVDDGYQHAQFFTVFLLGYVIARDDALWCEIARLRRVALGVMVTVAIPYAMLLMTLPTPAPLWLDALFRALRGVYVWTTLLCVLGYGFTYLNRAYRWLPYATVVVLPWYILHQTLLVILMYWLAPIGLPLAAEAALVLGGVVAGCAVLVEGIRRVPVLRLLFGLNYKVRTSERSLDGGA